MPGGVKAAPRSCAIGSYGASSGAKVAASRINPSRINPMRSDPRILSRLRSDGGVTGRATGASAVAVAGWAVKACSLIGDPRIEERIREIDDQADEDHQHRRQDGDRLNHGVIPRGDGCEEQLPHAGDCEDP